MKKIIIGLLIGLLLVSGLSYYYFFHSKKHPVSYRHLFLEAQNALSTQDFQTYTKLKTRLAHYPLYPYLLYTELTQKIDTASSPEIDNFLKTYESSYLSASLRQQWLIALARKQNWPLFLNYYRPSTDPQIQCLHAWALYNTDHQQEALNLGTKLWLVGYSQVSDCGPLFTIMQQAALITPEMIWQRFHLALSKSNLELATYLISLLPSSEQAKAKLWLIVNKSPEKINDTLLFPASDNQNNDIIVYGFEKLGPHAPTQAASFWHKLQKLHHFTYAQTQEIIQSIAIGFIKSYHQQPTPWLQQINPAYLTTMDMNLRLRFALISQNWPLLLQWIENLPENQQQLPQWQYWQARSLSQVGKNEQAIAIYKQLAQQTNFYGFLSAEILNQPYFLQNISSPFNLTDINTVKNTAGFLRTKELFALGKNEEASKEWWHTLLQFNEKQRYIAIKLALQKHWMKVALGSTTFISYPTDLSIRYPTLYKQTVKSHAKQLNLAPAFIYAIIRQESLFRADATSYAGALGLMQLMPSTAAMLIHQDNLNNASSLTDPATNIRLGSLYLSRLLMLNKNNYILASAAYNAGPNRIKAWLPITGAVPADIWIEMIPFEQTRTYVKNVMTNFIIYQYLLNQDTPQIKLFSPINSGQ